MEFYETPTDFTPYELAEWVEASILLAAASRVSATELEAQFPQNQRPDSADIEELLGEIRRRAADFPTLYPFRASSDEIFIDDAVDGTIYAFLLTLSIERAPYRVEDRFNEISPSLELITREAMLGMLGAGAEARRFGWPSDDGRPEYLGEAVEWIAREMGLQVGVVHDEVDADDKDGGIDVVAWHPIGDRAPAFPIWMIQVTTQVTFERKSADVQPEKWMSWITTGRPPQIGLAIPFAIAPDAKVLVAKLKYSTGLLLERLRILRLIAERDLTQFDEYETMREWTHDELAKIAGARAADDPRRRPKLPRVRRPIRRND